MRLELSGGPGAPRATLADPQDFKAFSVRVSNGADPTVLGVLPSDDDELRVPAALVEILAAAGPEWTTSFHAMLRASESHGWYDPATGLIRAHIEQS